MKKQHSTEQFVLLLVREADVELGKGEKVPEVCRKLGITQQTYYRWRTTYGSLEPKLVKQLQQLTRHFKHQAVQLSNKLSAALAERRLA
jgi:putative transposase